MRYEGTDSWIPSVRCHRNPDPQTAAASDTVIRCLEDIMMPPVQAIAIFFPEIYHLQQLLALSINKQQQPVRAQPHQGSPDAVVVADTNETGTRLSLQKNDNRFISHDRNTHHRNTKQMVRIHGDTLLVQHTYSQDLRPALDGQSSPPSRRARQGSPDYIVHHPASQLPAQRGPSHAPAVPCPGVAGCASVSAPAFAFFELRLPFGRPRGRFAPGCPSAPSSAPRFCVAAASVSRCVRRSFRYLQRERVSAGRAGACRQREVASDEDVNAARVCSTSARVAASADGLEGDAETTHWAAFSSIVACRLGNGGWPSSTRRRSTSAFAEAYSPSLKVLILVWRSFTLMIEMSLAVAVISSPHVLV